VVHLFNHGVTKAALFLLVGCAVAVVGGSSLSRLAGLGKVMPLTAFGIVLGGLGLIGVPGTAASSQVVLVLAALEQGKVAGMAIVATRCSPCLRLGASSRSPTSARRRRPAGAAEAPGAARPGLADGRRQRVLRLDASLTVGAAAGVAADLLGAGK